MTQALAYLWYIFDSFISCIFNDLEIATNVTVGWILVAVFIFALLIRNILNLPRSMGSFDKFREHEWSVDIGGRQSFVRKKRLH